MDFPNIPLDVQKYTISFLNEKEKLVFALTNKFYYKLFFPTVYPIYHTDDGKIQTRITYVKNLWSAINHYNKLISGKPILPNQFIIDQPLTKQFVDIEQLFLIMKLDICYLMGSTHNHFFIINGKIEDYTNNKSYSELMIMKMYPYKKRNNVHQSIYNKNNQIDTEIKISIMLSKLVLNNLTPHILLPITYFNTNPHYFGSMKINNNGYKKFINEYNNNKYDNFVSIIMYEPLHPCTSSFFFPKCLENLTILEWKIVFFQVLHTMAIIQKNHPNFLHNSLAPLSVLVIRNNNCKGTYGYFLNGTKFIIPDNLQIKIWNFSLSSINGLIDNSVLNTKAAINFGIGHKKNHYYDIHFFFNKLLIDHFNDIPKKEILQFIYRIVPIDFRGSSADWRFYNEKMVSASGRYIHDIEFLTPIEILLKDPLFEIFKQKKIDN